MALRKDAWLSSVLGFSAYSTGAEGETPESGERALTYAKLDVANTGAVAVLEQRDFAVVDVNVTLSRPGGAAATFDVPDGVAVSPFAADDGAALVQLAGRSFRYSRFHLDPRIPDELANRVKSEWVDSYVGGRRGVELLAAFSAGSPSGFLAVLDDGDAPVIDLIAVSPDAQGRGVGSALVGAFIARHGTANNELRVGTQIANIPSLRLYARFGFSVASAQYVLHHHVGA